MNNIYKGITLKSCKKFTLKCETLIYKWLKTYGKYDEKLSQFTTNAIPLMDSLSGETEFETVFSADPNDSVFSVSMIFC